MPTMTRPQLTRASDSILYKADRARFEANQLIAPRGGAPDELVEAFATFAAAVLDAERKLAAALDAHGIDLNAAGVASRRV